MYNRKNKIYDVLNFKIDSNFLVFKSNELERSSRHITVDNKIVNVTGITSYFTYKEKIIFSTFEKTTYIYFVSKDELRKIDYTQLNDIYLNNICLLQNGDYDCIYDIETEVELCKIERGLIGFISSIYNNSIISNTNNLIMSVSVISGTVNWTNQQQIVDVDRILGVFNNELFVLLKENILLSLDTETGSQNYHKQIINPFSEHPLWNAFWQIHNNKLVFYRFGWYIEYCGKKQEITYCFNVEEKLKQQNLHDNTSQYIVEGDLLYFYVSGFGSFAKPTLAILNIQTQEIIWKDIWDNDDTFYKDFQKNDNHLYVLDSENTLHIFEREVNEKSCKKL